MEKKTTDSSKTVSRKLRTRKIDKSSVQKENELKEQNHLIKQCVFLSALYLAPVPFQNKQVKAKRMTNINKNQTKNLRKEFIENNFTNSKEIIDLTLDLNTKTQELKVNIDNKGVSKPISINKSKNKDECFKTSNPKNSLPENFVLSSNNSNMNLFGLRLSSELTILPEVNSMPRTKEIENNENALDFMEIEINEENYLDHTQISEFNDLANDIIDLDDEIEGYLEIDGRVVADLAAVADEDVILLDDDFLINDIVPPLGPSTSSINNCDNLVLSNTFCKPVSYSSDSNVISKVINESKSNLPSKVQNSSESAKSKNARYPLKSSSTETHKNDKSIITNSVVDIEPIKNSSKKDELLNNKSIEIVNNKSCKNQDLKIKKQNKNVSRSDKTFLNIPSIDLVNSCLNNVNKLDNLSKSSTNLSSKVTCEKIVAETEILETNINKISDLCAFPITNKNDSGDKLTNQRIAPKDDHSNKSSTTKNNKLCHNVDLQQRTKNVQKSTLVNKDKKILLKIHFARENSNESESTTKESNAEKNIEIVTDIKPKIETIEIKNSIKRKTRKKPPKLTMRKRKKIVSKTAKPIRKNRKQSTSILESDKKITKAEANKKSSENATDNIKLPLEKSIIKEKNIETRTRSKSKSSIVIKEEKSLDGNTNAVVNENMERDLKPQTRSKSDGQAKNPTISALQKPLFKKIINEDVKTKNKVLLSKNNVVLCDNIKEETKDATETAQPQKDSKRATRRSNIINDNIEKVAISVGIDMKNISNANVLNDPINSNIETKYNTELIPENPSYASNNNTGLVVYHKDLRSGVKTWAKNKTLYDDIKTQFEKILSEEKSVDKTDNIPKISVKSADELIKKEKDVYAFEDEESIGLKENDVVNISSDAVEMADKSKVNKRDILNTFMRFSKNNNALTPKINDKAILKEVNGSVVILSDKPKKSNDKNVVSGDIVVRKKCKRGRIIWGRKKRKKFNSIGKNKQINVQKDSKVVSPRNKINLKIRSELRSVKNNKSSNGLRKDFLQKHISEILIESNDLTNNTKKLDKKTDEIHTVLKSTTKVAMMNKSKSSDSPRVTRNSAVNKELFCKNNSEAENIIVGMSKRKRRKNVENPVNKQNSDENAKRIKNDVVHVVEENKKIDTIDLSDESKDLDSSLKKSKDYSDLKDYSTEDFLMELDKIINEKPDTDQETNRRPPSKRKKKTLDSPALTTNPNIEIVLNTKNHSSNDDKSLHSSIIVEETENKEKSNSITTIQTEKTDDVICIETDQNKTAKTNKKISAKVERKPSKSDKNVKQLKTIQAKVSKTQQKEKKQPIQKRPKRSVSSQNKKASKDTENKNSKSLSSETDNSNTIDTSNKENNKIDDRDIVVVEIPRKTVDLTQETEDAKKDESLLQVKSEPTNAIKLERRNSEQYNSLLSVVKSDPESTAYVFCTTDEDGEVKFCTEYRRIHKCKICLEVFSSYVRLKKHKMIHEMKTENPYQCKVCQLDCLNIKDLTSHLRTHQGKMPYKCKKCEECFWTSNLLEKHELVHVLKKAPSTSSAPKKVFTCDLCQRSFKKICDLERHTRVHTGEKPSQCKICYKRFQQSYNLSKHLLTHTQEKQFECIICGKKFGRSDVLNRHVLTHSVDKPFHCNVCPKMFIRGSQLNLHMKNRHPEVKFEPIKNTA